MSRVITLVLLAVSLLLGACAHRVYESVRPDGTRVTATEMVYMPSTYTPIYGVQGGYRYIAPVGGSYGSPITVVRRDRTGQIVYMNTFCRIGRMVGDQCL